MVTLSERLKALGVQVDGQNLPKPKGRPHSIKEIVPGESQETPFGEAYVVNQFFPSDYLHGKNPLAFPKSLDRLAAWARDARIAALKPGNFLFLDTETSGLTTGSGTYAFLVGLGRFEDGGFRQIQFFLRDPIEEPAMISALEQIAAPAEALVTFNGKSFDIPLLKARYLTNAAPQPFGPLLHVDLLHLARRLWRDMLPSRALGDLEVMVLGVTRSEQEIPGWMIPQIYMDYLFTGDARPLASVFYHNSMDVLSMASLLEHLADKLADPMEKSEHHSERYAIGRLLADIGFAEEAIEIFESTLALKLPADVQFQLVENLACLFRQRGNYESALLLWEQAAADGHVYAHVEIAKYYEHKASNPNQALVYTMAAIEVIKKRNTPVFERVHWEPLLAYRRERLERKVNRRATTH